MTLQKIADAVGVGVGTVHRAIDGAELFQMEKLPGDDGKLRPMHYAARARRDALPECRPSPHGWRCAAIARVFDW